MKKTGRGMRIDRTRPAAAAASISVENPASDTWTPPFQADGGHQIERQPLGDGFWNGKIGTSESRCCAECEEER